MDFKMINIKSIFSILLLAGFFTSCVDYLEPYPNGNRTTEDVWKFQDMVQGLVGQCYDNMPRNYNDNEGVYLDGATDDVVITSTTNAISRLAVGALPTSMDPFRTYWDRDYRSIYLVNLFLKDRRGYNTKFLVNSHLDSLVKNRLQGEAFALRAWFQWDLLQKFGGKGMNGQLLGFPIVLEPIDIKEQTNLARNTYDECVKQIIADCDSAYKYLPLAHRDFLVPNVNDRAYAGGRYWGRFDGITTRAIKALVYLTWASPRFNPGNDITRWDLAAKNAKEVMDFKMKTDAVTNGFNVNKATNWFDPNFGGIIFSARYNNANDAMERMYYPGGFQGTGSVGATQEFVDAFPMKNGYPISDPRSLYDPSKPYENRDPRFYATIFHNNARAVKINTSTTMYTFENWLNGKDAAGPAVNSRTNYHIKKMVFMGLNWSDNSINRQPHAKFFIYWAQMCLTFAEAANQVEGPEGAKYGLSAKDAMAYLRKKDNTDGGKGFTTDPYLTEVASLGKAPFNGFIKNERRLETCFEGSRFYDLRRWTTDLASLNKPVHMAKIQKNADGTFTYNLDQVVEVRAYSSAYLPIPYDEMLRMSNLVQNEGWDAWK
ncbi:RagB/SusD family nutrient uptake outer membrane protein [Dyadobacter sp. LHD-138]|uniref:RagB/SusD family nutrient uptake outer membrane protein n=1 Tax=Dyadobacter sp. LHD-138 TaxID=3071413 RepID=UPI0027E0E0A0|nr:RagB/SusD family nutrient uptake outer membrane protein [Dyadobacter sp. LHD-138]MDQ6477948.1 RagB/SusD family nutrient uptake outer membrane protein [Dyadobacter sp. LHD-138]